MSIGKWQLVESRLMPPSSSCDSLINRQRGGNVIAEPFFRIVYSFRRVWESETAASLQTRCMIVPKCLCQLPRQSPSMCCIDTCLRFCAYRVNELCRVGFMSQQVTDDQINWSKASASSWISSGNRGFAGASQRCHCSRTLNVASSKDGYNTHTRIQHSYYSHQLNADRLLFFSAAPRLHESSFVMILDPYPRWLNYRLFSQPATSIYITAPDRKLFIPCRLFRHSSAEN